MDDTFERARLAATIHRALTRWLLINDRNFHDFVILLYEEIQDEYEMNG